MTSQCKWKISELRAVSREHRVAKRDIFASPPARRELSVPGDGWVPASGRSILTCHGRPLAPAAETP